MHICKEGNKNNLVLFIFLLAALFVVPSCIQEDIDYHLDSFYIYFSSSEQDGLKAVTYLSKEENNVSGVENAEFKEFFRKELINLKNELDDISSFEIAEWSINLEMARIKINFGDTSDYSKAETLEKIDEFFRSRWYSVGVGHDYKE